jgi:hypothetical protein
MKIEKALRRIGGSLCVAVPPEIVRAFDLRPGDFIHFNFGDEITMEFYTVTTSVTPAERVLEAAAE